MFTVSQEMANDGVPCDVADETEEEQDCGTDECAKPVDCIGNWGEWGDCTVSCGGGSQSRMFTVSQEMANDGVLCDVADKIEEEQDCGTDECAKPVDCIGNWGEWGDCTVSCGGGSQSRMFTVSVQEANGGRGCSTLDAENENRDCGMELCAVPEPEPEPEARIVDCRGRWSKWSDCDAPCGDGSRVRVFNVEEESANGGSACTSESGSEEVEPCVAVVCPEPGPEPQTDFERWCSAGDINHSPTDFSFRDRDCHPILSPDFDPDGVEVPLPGCGLVPEGLCCAADDCYYCDDGFLAIGAHCCESLPNQEGGQCEDSARYEGVSLKLELTLKMSIMEALDPTSSDGFSKAFKTKFRREIAAPLNLKISRVQVKNIRAGSLVLTFHIYPIDGDRTAFDVLEEAQALVADSSSQIFDGELLKTFDFVVGLVVLDCPDCPSLEENGPQPPPAPNDGSGPLTVVVDEHGSLPPHDASSSLTTVVVVVVGLAALGGLLVVLKLRNRAAHKSFDLGAGENAAVAAEPAQDKPQTSKSEQFDDANTSSNGSVQQANEIEALTVENPVSVEPRPIRDNDETVGGEAVLNDDGFEVEAVGDEAVADDI
jgi:hypothetical protein